MFFVLILFYESFKNTEIDTIISFLKTEANESEV